jgi:hypothetical protein
MSRRRQKMPLSLSAMLAQGCEATEQSRKRLLLMR